MNHNLYTLLNPIQSDRQKTFLTTEDYTSINYGQIDRLAALIAYNLNQLGVKKGDRAIAVVNKSVEALALYLACLRAGIVFVPLNPAFTANELEYFFNNAEPKIVVGERTNFDLISSVAARCDVKTLQTIDPEDHNSLVATTESFDFDSQTVAEVAKDDPAVMIYTSGTTGKPKGAVLSHHNLTVNGRDLKNHWGFSSADVLLHSLPIFHVHGLFFATHCVMLSNASMIFLPKFDAAKIVQHLERATVMMGVPTYYTRLLGHPEFDRKLCSRMRLFISGSAPLRQDTFAEFEARTGLKILERYGMSETGINTSNPLEGERRLGTVGLSLGKSELRIVNNADEPLPSDEIGQVQVKGENVFQGYWQMPEKTKAEFTQDGFFRTGDLGFLSSDNYLTLVGRAKDLIISGGMNVYPKEVENCLNQISGVVESAVIGLPDPDFGEAVTAVLVVDENFQLSRQELKLLLKPELANYKIPKQTFIVENLPRNAMGKIQKNKLRESSGLTPLQ